MLGNTFAITVTQLTSSMRKSQFERLKSNWHIDRYYLYVFITFHDITSAYIYILFAYLVVLHLRLFHCFPVSNLPVKQIGPRGHFYLRLKVSAWV